MRLVQKDIDDQINIKSKIKKIKSQIKVLKSNKDKKDKKVKKSIKKLKLKLNKLHNKLATFKYFRTRETKRAIKMYQRYQLRIKLRKQLLKRKSINNKIRSIKREIKKHQFILKDKIDNEKIQKY